MVSVLKNHPQAVSKLATTDTPPALTRILKGEFPELQCSPSVAHPYDIKRYNSAVKNTLITLEVAIENKDLYDRVWLDEWDLTSHNGKTKKLYTEEIFEKLRAAGLKINVVTPELHRTSPHLLGGESHPDAMSLERLFVRVHEILELQPDGICTDYPEEVLDLLGKTASIVR